MKRAGIAVFFALLALVLPGAAFAAPPQLWQLPEAGPASGAGAGQLRFPHGVAADPVSGNLYVADGQNNRIDEFTAWGVFVKALGWNVNAAHPEEKLQVCTANTGCQAGSPGAGAGQVSRPEGLATDSAGNLYVVDYNNHRVQKFDDEGHFVLMFGGEVNKTTHGNLCTAASTDLCGIGVVGAANGHFAAWPGIGVGLQFLAVGPDDSVYVGDEDRIQIFDPEGVYQGQLGLPKEGEAAGGATEGKGRSGSLAVDSAGNVYFDFEPNFKSGIPEHPGIFKHSAAGWSLFANIAAAKIGLAKALATDSAGNVFAVGIPLAGNSNNEAERVFEFDSAGNQLIPSKAEEEDPLYQQEQIDGSGTFPGFARRDGSEILGLASSDNACGIPGGGIYASYWSGKDSLLAAFGNPPDPLLCPPPRNPPAITDQYATAVGARQAILRAKISSRFWPSTTYRVQYGTEPCELGGCALTPLRDLNSKSNSAVTTAGILLTDLAPGVTYHYRFLASTCFETKPSGDECEAGQEVEVRGVGGTPGADGAEGEITTAEPVLSPRVDCPNQAFRTGASAPLPDCRAYEMVSPLDKAGGDIVALVNVSGYPARLDQSAISGDRITYSAYRSFGGSRAGGTSSQYLARRSDGLGWATDPISPPFGRSLLAPGANVDREYKLFSPDLCQAWLRLDYAEEPVLDPDAVEGFPNLFRRDNCSGGYEALSTLTPPHQEAQTYLTLETQGVSADGSLAIYLANDNLTPEAPAINALSGQGPQLYARGADGTTRFVCFLPNGSTPAQSCVAGAGNGEPRTSRLTGAISADGSRVFFTSGGGLYLRTNPTAEQSPVSGGQCTEAEKACTTAIPGGGDFWAASVDGGKVLYSTAGGALREYDVEEALTTTIAGSGTLGVLGQSEDLSRVYFASSAKLAPEASVGKANLYYREAGEAPRYLGALAGADVSSGGQEGGRAIVPEPSRRAARVSPDGLSAAFVSTAPLTGYDNTDARTGDAATEVFVYRAQANGGEGALYCASCEPGGARPTGVTLKNKPWEGVRAAAWIPTWESSLFAPRALSADGERLFFNSLVSLLARDTNGKQDVYEWQDGEGKVACEARGAERSLPGGGCLSLISSGEGTLDSEFLDASPTSRDVFFSTGSSLLPQDPGLIDIYDAREGGGFPVPAAPPAACEGEACQSPPAAPNDSTPASSTFQGAGNVHEAPARKKHKKKKHKHKANKHKAKAGKRHGNKGSGR